jgi:hypothetical protein
VSRAGLEDTWNLPEALFGSPAIVPAPDPIFAERDHRDRSGRVLLGATTTSVSRRSVNTPDGSRLSSALDSSASNASAVSPNSGLAELDIE